MEEHFIYSRPVVVTEDKIKEALAKQAKQRALKAALDQQVLESERLKAEAHRAKGRKDKKSLSKSSRTSAGPLSALEEHVSGQASPRSHASPGPSPPLPLPPSPAVSNTHAGPSGAIEPTRYTFSFKEGQGTFEVTDSSVHPLQNTLQPSSADGRAPVGSGDGGGAAVPTSKVKERKRDGPQPARRTPSSRDSARENAGSGGRGGSSNNRARRKVSPSVAGGGEYQTNSLPANFKLNKDAGSRATASRDRIGSGGSRPSRAASREKAGGGRGAASGDSSSTSNNNSGGGYDTQSLPVELIYKLSQGGALPSAAGAKERSPLSQLKLPHPPQVTSPQRSPSASHISDSVGVRSPKNAQSGPPGSPGSAVRERSGLLSPRADDRGGGRLHVSQRGGRAGHLTTPLDGATPGRPSARPAGGILPPLNGRRDSDVIEMSAILEARTPVRENNSNSSGGDSGGCGGGVPRRRTSSTPKDRSPLPPGGASSGDMAATEQARKQVEREKGWAQQVKQLKAELRKARQKAGNNGKTDVGPGRAPRRAETAPDPPAGYPPGKAPRGVGGGLRQRRVEGGVGGNGSSSGGCLARPTRLEKMDFSKAHIFSRETFRPITAPEDATTYFGGLLRSPPPAPRAPLPLVQPKAASPAPAPVAVSNSVERAPAPSNRAMKSSLAEAEMFAQVTTTTQDSEHTITSGEESLKLASLTTRQMLLGLPDYGDGEPVPIQFLHLRQFVEAQIITANQAEDLWEFFALSLPAEFGGSGEGGSPVEDDGGANSVRQHHYDRRSSAQADLHEEEAVGQHNQPDNSAAAEEMESHIIEVEEMAFDQPSRSPHGAVSVSAGHDNESKAVPLAEDIDDDDTEVNEDDIFVPHSPSQPLTNAVLAPALRRKISQLHSEEAALLLQHHQQQLRNGRQRPNAVVADVKSKKGAVTQDGEEALMSPKRGPTPSNPTPSPHHDADAPEAQGTFDTYSELKLSRNVLPGAAGDDD
jgi:hypothetical protein